MFILYLIILSVAFSVLSCIYLSKIKVTVTEDNEVIKNKSSSPKKRIILMIIASVLIIGVAIELPLVFTGNTLISNMKLITVLFLIAIAAIVDFDYHIIPNLLILCGFGLRLIYAIAEFIVLKEQYLSIIKSDAMTIVLVLLLLLLGAVFIKHGIAMGDVKLLAVMGLFQGFTGFISSMFCSLLITFFVGVFLLISKKRKRKDAIAFAPALFFGTLISIVLTGM